MSIGALNRTSGPQRALQGPKHLNLGSGIGPYRQKGNLYFYANHASSELISIATVISNLVLFGISKSVHGIEKVYSPTLSWAITSAVEICPARSPDIMMSRLDKIIYR